MRQKNAGNILATFSTGPAIKDTSNLISEILAPLYWVLTIFALGLYLTLQTGIGTFAVGTLIVSIGLSLGGTTGYALNPCT